MPRDAPIVFQASSSPLAPVDADDVAARLDEIRKDRRRADAEVDERHAGAGEAVEDPLRVREHELAIVGAAERAGPRIEDLQRLRTSRDLRAQVGRHRVRRRARRADASSRAART